MGSEYVLLINKFLMFAYYLLMVIVSIYGIINIKKLSNNFKLLILLIVISTCAEIFNYFTFTFHFLTIKIYYFTIPINMALFYFILKPYWKNKNIIFFNGVITIIAIIFSIYTSIFIVEFEGYPSIELTFLSVLTIIFALVTLKAIISSPAQNSLFIKPEFWLSITILVFFTISYLNLSLFEFYLFFVKNNYNIVELIFRIFTILYYIGFFIAIYYNIKLNNENRS